MWLSKLSKLSKKKKIILLTAVLGIITTSIVTPIVINNLDNDKISKKDIDKQDVQEVIKILEEKPLLERKIKLASDSKGNIIANNKTQIITKIKELIGTSNLKGVLIEISIKQDKEISTIFEKIIVEISKGNYSQIVSEDKTILVRRSKKAIEIGAIDVKEVASSLKALRFKTVEVYIKNASALKITNNKNEILEAIKKLEGYKDIDLKEVKIDVKNSNDLLPENSESPVAIDLILSKNGFNSSEISGFRAKQMSTLQMAEFDVNHVKKSLENLNQKIIQVDTRKSFDQKISTNKDKIVEELKKLKGYSEIALKEVEIKVKELEKLIPRNTEEAQTITLILSKNNFDVELTSFKVKSLSEDEIDVNKRIVTLVKEILESLPTKNLEVYIENASALEITNNKNEILKEIRKIEGYSEIEFEGANIDVKNSNDLLPENSESPIAIDLVLSKPGVSLEVKGFKAKQMSPQRMANIDIDFVKNALESLKTKIIEINSFDSLDQKITTNKAKILFEIEKIKGYSKIELKGVNIDVKDSDTLLPKNNQLPIVITLVLSKANALPNNIELTIFSAKQQFDVIANIENKIIDKNILINPNVTTSNRDESLIAIRNQLQKENPSLTNEDLLKILLDDEVWSLKLNRSKKTTLTIAFNNRRRPINVYVTKGNSYLFLNSNITNGYGATIFQDKFGNLWAMGNISKLQVLKKSEDKDGYVETGWTSDTSSGLTKDSTIETGYGGTIFQDSFGNLWAMGNRSKLQVLKVNENKNGYVETGWTSDTALDLTKGSNIKTSYGGKIFQDEFGNLWSMGYFSKLQVLKVNQNKDGYVKDGWTSDTTLDLTKGSNITNGQFGAIFQDKFKNLWAMGANSKLQVLKVNSKKDGYVKDGWTSDNTLDLTKGSNITNGLFGTIFQDKFYNLWTIGNGSKLQVLKANSKKDGYIEGWTNNNEEDTSNNLLKGSNIEDDWKGTIFQDDFGNLWTMGKNLKLQVLKANENKNGYVDEGWTSKNDENTRENLLKGSKIKNGSNGTIFQDEFGNLWAMGEKSKLQVLKKIPNEESYVETGWTSGTTSGLTKSSNIEDGWDGTIFQDSFGNLWAIGYNTKLQVLRKDPITKNYIDSWQNS